MRFDLTVRSASHTHRPRSSHQAGRLMSAAFEKGLTMPQKSLLALTLILTSLLLSGCDGHPSEPPLLSTCDTLECSDQQAWRTS